MIHVLHISGARHHSREIAFTAKLSVAGHAYEVSLLLGTIISNIGWSYSKNTGKFTCSRNGVYVFHTSLTATVSTMFAHMYLNGDDQLRLYSAQPSTEAGTGHTPSFSQHLVLSLVVGDQVWVGNGGNNGLHLYYPSSFSGFLLYWTYLYMVKGTCQIAISRVN
jgi:hypothetical protein